MPSESFAGALSGATRRETCSNCKHTVRVQELNGQRVITDVERISIVVTGAGGFAKQRVEGRRLHSESCERLKRETERAKLRAEREQWEASQAAKAAKAAAKPAKSNGKPAGPGPLEQIAESLRQDYVTLQASMRKLKQRVESAAKRGRTRGM